MASMDWGSISPFFVFFLWIYHHRQLGSIFRRYAFIFYFLKRKDVLLIKWLCNLDRVIFIQLHDSYEWAKWVLQGGLRLLFSATGWTQYPQ